jgi:hypothetical protein
MPSYEAYFMYANPVPGGPPWPDLYGAFNLDPGTYKIAYVRGWFAGNNSGGAPGPVGPLNYGYIHINSSTNYSFSYDLLGTRPIVFNTNEEVGVYILKSQRTYDFPDAKLTSYIRFEEFGYTFSNLGGIGPDLVFRFGNGYFLESAIQQMPPVFVDDNYVISFPTALPLDDCSGYPIAQDFIDPMTAWYLDYVHSKLYRMTQGNPPVATYVGIPNINVGPLAVYSMRHDPVNDRLLVMGGADRNFWEQLASEYTLTVNAIPLATLRTADIPTNFNFVPLPIPQNSDTFGKGGWDADFDNLGNMYAAFTSGEICKINVSKQTTEIIARGFIEPWSVYIIDKNSEKPHIIVANTRGGSLDLIYPDGTVTTIIGETNLLWKYSGGGVGPTKPITDGGIPGTNSVAATFGCPTRLTLLPDNRILIGDETGLAIRVLTSPMLSDLINRLNSIQVSHPAVPDSTIIRYNNLVDSEPFSNVHISDINLYYHSYSGLPNSGIIVFPFCLDLAKVSGSINISRLDKFEIIYPKNLFNGNYIYSVRYNVLKFANGHASLLYF